LKIGNVLIKKIIVTSAIFAIILPLISWTADNSKFNLKEIGTLHPKNSKDISSSPWGIQAGTLDEDILAKASEIGVKWTRLSADWPAIEIGKGNYNWDQTDKAFAAALEKSITPFVTLGGANKLYSKTRLDLEPKLFEIYGKRPEPPTKNPVAFEAWLEFVKRTVQRYKDKIKYWEVWNEPNHFAYWGAEPNGFEYGLLLKETAKIIRSIDPAAKILAGSMAGLDPEFTDAFLSTGNKDLVDIITYHNYGAIPEERIYKAIQVWDIINKYNPKIKIWQGECGYPSHSSTRDYRGSSPWGLLIQAKWLLRQSFTDIYFCHASLSNYFKLFHKNGRGEIPERSFLTKIDSILGFPERAGSRVKEVGVNEKCLLANPSLEPKPAFYAYQNLCALIDSKYKPVEFNFKVDIKNPGIFYGIGKEDDAFPSIPLVAKFKNENNRYLISYWLPWYPQELIKYASIDLELLGVEFTNPVLIDLLDGKVYEISDYDKGKDGTILYGIPMADYPLIVAEKQEVDFD